MSTHYTFDVGAGRKLDERGKPRWPAHLIIWFNGVESARIALQSLQYQIEAHERGEREVDIGLALAGLLETNSD